MSKKNKQKQRAEKTKKRTIERRNRRHQYSPKPPAAPRKRWNPFIGTDGKTQYDLAAMILFRAMMGDDD
jgi:hypothetical protein